MNNDLKPEYLQILYFGIKQYDTTQIRLYLSIFTPYRQNSGIVTSPKKYEFLKFNLLSKMEKNSDFTSKMANFKGPKKFFFQYTLEKKKLCTFPHMFRSFIWHSSQAI